MPADEVFLISRESPTNNEKDDLRRLAIQDWDLDRFVSDRHLVVRGRLSRVCSGVDPRWLLKAKELIDKLGPTVKVLFQRPNRVCRPAAFHPQKRPNELPREDEWEDALICLGHPTVMTILKPSASNSEDAKYRDKVGKEAAALRKPGSKKSRRMELEPRALALYEELGSERKVARALNVALSTVYYWVKTRDDQRPNL